MELGCDTSVNRPPCSPSAPAIVGLEQRGQYEDDYGAKADRCQEGCNEPDVSGYALHTANLTPLSGGGVTLTETRTGSWGIRLLARREIRDPKEPLQKGGHFSALM